VAKFTSSRVVRPLQEDRGKGREQMGESLGFDSIIYDFYWAWTVYGDFDP